MWSRKAMSKKFAAFMSCLVILMSSEDGSGFPEGWLCTRMNPAAKLRMASLKISRGWMMLASSVPIEMRDFLIRALRVSNESMMMCSFFWLCNWGERNCVAFNGASIIILWDASDGAFFDRFPNSKAAFIWLAFANPIPFIVHNSSSDALAIFWRLPNFWRSRWLKSNTDSPAPPRPKRIFNSSSVESDSSPIARSRSRGRSEVGRL